MSQVDARVLPVSITAGEFTFAQLYGKDVDKPLLRLRDGVLLVQANGHSVSRNADRWKGRLYFKAGVYIQGDGCAKTYFDQLHITFWTTDG